MKKFSTFFLILISLIILIPGVNSSRASGTLYLYQDMDNALFPPVGWSVTNSSGYNWVRSSQCSGYGNGNACAVCDFYDVASGSFNLITPTFPATTSGDSVSFDHAYTCASSENDNMSVYTSPDGGTTWNLLINLPGGASGPLTTAPPTMKLFIPTSSQWATKRYALPVGTNAVKFTGNSAFGNNLYLDNIRVGVPYGTDVGANTVNYPKWGITPGSYSPAGSVRNYGTSTQSFSVTLTINPGSYSNTQSVTNLAPGQTQQVTFSSFNFSSNGLYTCKAYSTLAADQNHANDTVTSYVTVTPAPRKPVLEFSTGTWCQWCACGDAVADTFAVRYPNNSVIFAYHGGGGGDPYQTFNGNGILSMLGIGNAFPSGCMDRRGTGTGLGWGSFFTDAEYRMSITPSSTVNIVITSQNYNSTNRQLSVSLDATALSTLNGTYNINYTITEDNLVYTQTGNSYCPGNGSWVHNWVTRNLVNGASGENISTGTWNANQTYSKSFTTTLDNAWVAGNCNLNIFIYNASSGTSNSSEIQSATKVPITLTGVINENSRIPKQYQLDQNYPNPFNPTTNIKFAIPKSGNASLKIYDAIGRLVAVYYDGFIKAGYYNAEVDASGLSSGVYFYTLYTTDFVQTKKMIVLK